jgi:hypothetical protein
MGVSLFRGYAPVSFGSFDRALSSMFRLTAGETWIDELVLLDPETGLVNLGTALFIGSYIVIVVWILLQVSVAVLLVCLLPLQLTLLITCIIKSSVSCMFTTGSYFTQLSEA